MRGIEGDKAVLGDDPMAVREGYSDCCGMLGITCWKDDSSCVASVYWLVSRDTCTGVLVDSGTYGPCIKAGGPLWFTGNSLNEKLLNSLVSVIAA